MSTSSQTYKELAIPYFKETFDCMDEIMQELKVQIKNKHESRSPNADY